MNQRDRSLPIPDVQATPDTRRLAIDRVGIKAIRHPVKVRERAGGVQHTIAMFNMYVGLPHQFKGTHMSRFVEILNAHEREISPDTFRLMLREMVRKLEALIMIIMPSSENSSSVMNSPRSRPRSCRYWRE